MGRPSAALPARQSEGTFEGWRRVWESNPRYPFGVHGLANRCRNHLANPPLCRSRGNRRVLAHRNSAGRLHLGAGSGPVNQAGRRWRPCAARRQARPRPGAAARASPRENLSTFWCIPSGGWGYGRLQGLSPEYRRWGCRGEGHPRCSKLRSDRFGDMLGQGRAHELRRIRGLAPEPKESCAAYSAELNGLRKAIKAYYVGRVLIIAHWLRRLVRSAGKTGLHATNGDYDQP